MKIAQGKFTMVADEDHCIATIVFEPPLDDTLVECSGKGVTIYEALLNLQRELFGHQAIFNFKN